MIYDEMLTVKVNGKDKILASLLWADTDPHAVKMVFHAEVRVHWLVSRERLTQAIKYYVAVGEECGDVRFEPAGGGESLRMIVDSPTGYAEIDFDLQDLAQFVAATDEVVPVGREFELLDAMIEDELQSILEAGLV